MDRRQFVKTIAILSAGAFVSAPSIPKIERPSKAPDPTEFHQTPNEESTWGVLWYFGFVNQDLAPNTVYSMDCVIPTFVVQNPSYPFPLFMNSIISDLMVTGGYANVTGYKVTHVHKAGGGEVRAPYNLSPLPGFGASTILANDYQSFPSLQKITSGNIVTIELETDSICSAHIGSFKLELYWVQRF